MLSSAAWVIPADEAIREINASPSFGQSSVSVSGRIFLATSMHALWVTSSSSGPSAGSATWRGTSGFLEGAPGACCTWARSPRSRAALSSCGV
eukprot:3646519-Pyramimonas_sp.AAC.1